MEGAERRELLAAIRRSLRREAGMLAVRPEMTWQQLHNRVQWAGSVVTDVLDRERRRQPPARTWFWLQSPPTESSALIGVLGNTDSAFAFTPDGSMLIIARAGFLQYSNLLTGMPARTMEFNGGAERPVRSCAVSPDGSFIVTATVHGLQLWRLPTGELLRTLESGELADENGAHSGASGTRTGPPHLDASPAALPCAVSPDTSFVVGTGPDHAVRIWDTATGQLRAAFTGHTEPVTACAISGDGSLVVSASADGTVRLWDPEAGWLGTIFAVFHGGRRRNPTAAPGSAADPGAEDPARAGTGPEEVEVRPVNGCAIGPDASFLAAVSEDMVTVWDLPSGQVRWSDQHVGGAQSCAVSPDGTLVVSGGERGDLRLWDASSGAELCALSGHTGPVYACAVSPDATIIASRADDGIRMWDARARGEQESLEGHGKRITACRFDPAGERLASAAADSTVVVWEARGRRRIATLDGHDDVVQDCVFTADGRQLVSASRDGTVRVWDVRDGTQRIFTARHPVWGCAPRPDGGAVLFSWGKRPAQWDLQTGQHLMAYESQHAETWRCAFSPDGSWAVTSGGDGTLTVYDTESGEKRAALNGHTKTAGVCAVSPDGTFIVSGSADHTVRIWDACTFRQRHLLKGHSNEVWGCAVSPDARVVASTSWDGSLCVWSAETGRELMRLQLPVSLTALTFHPWRPVVALGDQAGWLHRVELMGLDPGPVIVTAHEADGALYLQCPACRTVGPVAETTLGHDLPCPACGISLRLAASVLRTLPEPGAGRGHQRAIPLAGDPGGDDERARRLMSVMKTCPCGTQYELLRYACPNCGNSISISAPPLPFEVTEFMENRQRLANLHVDRGVLLAKRGQHEDALAEYGKAIQANPWNATAYQNVGAALWQLGDPTEALRWYEKAHKLDPRRALPAQMAALIHRVRGLEAHARTEMQAGRRDAALADLTAAADLCGQNRYRQQIEHAIQALSAG